MTKIKKSTPATKSTLISLPNMSTKQVKEQTAIYKNALKKSYMSLGKTISILLAVETDSTMKLVLNVVKKDKTTYDLVNTALWYNASTNLTNGNEVLNTVKSLYTTLLGLQNNHLTLEGAIFNATTLYNNRLDKEIASAQKGLDKATEVLNDFNEKSKTSPLYKTEGLIDKAVETVNKATEKLNDLLNIAKK